MEDDVRHVYGPRPVGVLVPAVTREAFRKRSPAAAQVMADRYERTRRRLDHRNGRYHRMLVTELGAITDLRVPRRRLVGEIAPIVFGKSAVAPESHQMFPPASSVAP